MGKGKNKYSSMRDKAKGRAETRQQSGGGGTKFKFPEGSEVKFFQPKKGTANLDVIPYEVTVDNHPAGVDSGDLWYQRTIWVHYGIGSEDKAYLCLKTIGKKCPICDARAAMLKDGDADEKLIDALKPKEREVYNVIDLDDEKEGVQLFEMSYHTFGKKLEEEIREGDDELAGFADLKDGKTLKVRFTEKKMGKNTFLEASRIDFIDRDDYDEEILEDVLDLDAILNIIPYDKLEGVFLETEDEDPPAKTDRKKKKKDDDDEEDEKPKKKKKKPVDDEEEEEEEEKPKKKKKVKEEEDEEEEEEEKPKKKKDKKKSKKDEEEEDEEEEEKPKKKKKKDDDDEEEEEKPKKKKKKDDDDEEECPENGTFGKDCDKLDECFECELWEACKKKQKELKKK